VTFPRKRRPIEIPDEAEITARYGLEPVFEPGAPQGSADTDTGVPADPLAPFVQVQCPYCGEPFETRLDLSGGSASYVEDCQVCCQPIEFVTTVDGEGVLASLELRRGD